MNDSPQAPRGHQQATDGSKLRIVLLIFIISALPLIALLIYLNVQKRQGERGGAEATTPAAEIVDDPKMTATPADDA